MQYVLRFFNRYLENNRIWTNGGFRVNCEHWMFQGVYQAVVAVNPVVDLVAMLFSTDIPDW